MQIELVGSICVFLIFRLIRPKSLRIAVNVVATALFFLLLDNHDNFQGLQLFCCGMIIYDIQPFLMSSLKSDRVRNAVGLPLIVFGVAVAMWWVKRPELPSVQPLLVLLGLGRFQARQIAAVLTVLGVILAPKAKRFLSLPLFQFLGAISFPLYLVHSTIEVLLSGWPLVFLRGQMGELAAGALTLVATIGFSLIVSVVFLRLVERPAIQISSRVAKRFDMFKLNWRTA